MRCAHFCRADPVLPRHRRLTEGSAIRQVVRKGARVTSQTSIGYFTLTDEHGVEAAFICGKAVGNAVVRNRARRRYQAAVASAIGPSGSAGSAGSEGFEGPAARGLRVVWRLRPAAAGAAFAAIEDDVGRLLASAQKKRSGAPHG